MSFFFCVSVCVLYFLLERKIPSIDDGNHRYKNDLIGTRNNFAIFLCFFVSVRPSSDSNT